MAPRREKLETTKIRLYVQNHALDGAIGGRRKQMRSKILPSMFRGGKAEART